MSGDGSGDAAVPAAGVINQTMPLEVVAQQESTRSYFLAQTLESTRTVPIVSANLPLDKGTSDGVAEPEAPAEGDGSSEDEGGEDSDESDPGASDDASAVTPGVSAESTVVGSFEYRGITYAVEPGGESVAVVAADYAKLPQELVEAQTIVLPSMVTSDGLDFYTVSRIADHAFAGINEVVAVAAQNGQDADAPSSMQAQAEACAYGDDATAEASGDDDVADDADPKSPEGDDMTDDEADDAASSTLEEAAIGITAVTVPASIVEIGDDAFTNCDTLQYVIVSEDNPNYSMYDGCLYDADQQSLLLIPEGRLGAVRIPSTAVNISEDVSSHCAHLTAFIVDADSAASQLLAESDFYNASTERIAIVPATESGTPAMENNEAEEAGVAPLLDAAYNETLSTTGVLDLQSIIGLEVDFGSDSLRLAASEELDISADKRSARVVGRVAEVVIREEGDSNSVPHYVVVTLENAVSSFDDQAVPQTMDDADQAVSYGASDTGSYGIELNGLMDLRFAGSSRAFYYGPTVASITWTAGSASGPAVGSVVNVNVESYRPNGGEATKEMLVNAGLGWGGSATRELVGIKNSSTGSYVSLDSIFSGGQFSYSFIMPSSGCSIGSSMFKYASAVNDTAFQPVFHENTNTIHNTYYLGSTAAYWQNPSTGVVSSSNNYGATTYSVVGNSTIAPTNSIPIRSGYLFAGWYTAASGGSIVPNIAAATDDGREYYAHWVEAKNSFTYSGGQIHLAPLKTGRCFMHDSTQFHGTVTWSGSGSTPQEGDYVSIHVTQYRPNGGETTKEMLVNAGLEWGGSASRELIGIRNTSTGSYVSLETIYSGGAFDLSFIMPKPSSSCVVSSTQIWWTDSTNGTTFEPVFEDKVNSIYTHFNINGGVWQNPTTNTLSLSNNYHPTTYSTIGDTFIAPTNSIPTRSGYTFIGWYDAPSGGSVLSGVPTIEDNGKTFYAHWAAANYSMEINGYASLTPNGSGRCFLYDSNNFKGVATWENGTATMPAPGTIVTLRVINYRPNGGETTLENLVNAGLEWGGSQSKELIGIRNTDTGSYVSLETMYSGDEFVISFAMPSSGITFTSSKLQYANVTTFEPVYRERTNTIYNTFVLNASNAAWKNPPTGQLSNSANHGATTYSTIGEEIITPTNSIPIRNGYIFTGWFTAPTGGHIVSGQALASDNGKTYYAHWGNKDSVYYFLRLHGNGATVANPISWSIEAGTQFSLAARIFDKVGQSITSWTSNQDGSGNKYEVERLYDAFPNNSTTDLYAQWTIDTYTMNYDLAGGTKAEGGSYPESYTYGTGTVSVSDPVRPGYEFAGWTGTGLDEPTFDLVVDRGTNDKLGAHEPGTAVYERSYTATWRPYSYNVEFYDGQDGHTGDKIADDQSGFTYGTAKALAPANLVDAKPGYHVTGWRIGAPDSSERVEGVTGDISVFDEHAPTADDPVQTVRLYAEWTPNDFTVTLHDGASADPAQTGFAYSTDDEAGKDKAIAAASFTREAYHITGWAYTAADAADGARVKAFEGATPVIASATLAADGRIPAHNSNLDLYAVWEPDDHTVKLSTERITAWDIAAAAGFKPASSWSFATDQKSAENVYNVESSAACAVTDESGVVSTVSDLVLLPVPACNFYAFEGWEVVSGDVTLTAYTYNGKKTYGFTAAPGAVHEDIELKALWSEVVYDLMPKMKLDKAAVRDYAAGTYDIYSAAEGSANPVPFDWKYTVSGTTDGNALPDLVAKPGYTFVGWSSPSEILKTDAGDVAANAEPVKDASLRANLTSLSVPRYELTAHFAVRYFPLTLDTASADAALNASEPDVWKQDGTSTVYAHTMPNGESGYTVDVDDRTIVLPTPTRMGYTFTGWEQTSGQTDATVLFAPDATAGETHWKFVLPEEPTDTVLDSYGFTARWTECPYSIEFGNVEHVDGFIAGAIDEDGSTHSVKAFDGSALEGSKVIAVGAPADLDADRYEGFARWVTRTDMSADTLNGWTRATDDAGDYWYIGEFTIARENLEAFYGAGSGTGAAAAQPFQVRAEYDLKHFRAYLDLDGGTLGDDGLEKTWVEEGYDYTCESGAIRLPVPTKYGYEPADPTAWKVSANGATADVSQGNDGGYTIPADSYGDRTYAIQWRGKMDSVKLDANAPADVMGLLPDARTIVVQHGKAMDALDAPTVVPARTDGYAFAGYFDTAEETGGKQYYTRELASARAWDKEPAADGAPHALYARWTKDAGAGETVVVADGDDVIDIEAADVRGAEHPAFVATYHGTYRSDAFGRVKADVDSYALTGATAEGIYESFKQSETGPYLLGFRVKSTGSVIAFSDIAMGNAFSFEAKASELAGGAAAPSLALNASSIEVLYTDKPFDFGGGNEPIDPAPGEDDEIMAIWNANGGAFAPSAPGASAITSATTMTLYDKGEDTRVKLPAAPERTGYAFVGWSKAAAHATDADHTLDGSDEMFRPTSIAPATYYAHWTPLLTDVVFDGNGDDAKTKARVNGFPYDLVNTRLGSTQVNGTTLPDIPVRTGYLFCGYFDAAEGGVQYYTSAGVQARPWDKVPSESGDALHTLYAQWTKESGIEVPPSTPIDPEPDDPFPGIPLVPGTVNTIVTKDPNNLASLSAAKDGVPASNNAVITGVHDGKITYRTSVENADAATYRPAGDDDVAIYLYSYAFDTADVLARFKAAAPAETPYLQGFRVKSTGCFLPLATLDAKASVRIDCKGEDLSQSVLPASFRISASRVEPVFGTTPAVPSPSGDYDWPVPFETQVENIFDASVGRFANGANARYVTVASTYKLSLQVPDSAANPTYKPEEGWSFEGWYTALGRQVADADGNLVADPDQYLVDSPYPTTFYAHYTQSRHAVTFDLGEAGDYPFTGTAPAATSAYHGQKIKDVTFPNASTAQDGFYRVGFDFLGWYDADGAPYFVTDAAPTEDRVAYQAMRETPITQKVELTAKWRAKTYTLTFHYNDTTVVDPKYVHHEADPEPRTVVYGEALPEGFIPQPTSPGYPFMGWYRSRDFAPSSVLYTAAGDAYAPSHFASDGHGGYLFKPTDPATPTAMDVFARFDTRDTATVQYTITVYPGDHGSFGGNDDDQTIVRKYGYATPDIALSQFIDRVVPDAGWQFSYLEEQQPDGTWTPVDYTVIPTHSVGDRTYRAAYKPLDGTYSIALNLGDNKGGAGLNDTDAEAWGANLTRAIDVTMDETIVLPSAFELDGFLGYEFLGWYKADAAWNPQSEVPTASVNPKALIEDPANERLTTFRYVAKWAPKAFEITFKHTEAGSAEEDIVMKVGSYEDRVTLPEPATVHNGFIFTNWGTQDYDWDGKYGGWFSGATIPFADLVQAAYLDQPTAREELEQHGRLTLYANWTNHAVGATLPLQVNMLIDPFIQKIEVSDAWIGTRSNVPVKVESLTVKLAGADAEGPGTSAIFSDGAGVAADDFALTVAAGEEPTDALAVSLGSDDVFRDLAPYGFTSFDSSAALPVTYGLKLPAGVDLTRFAELMSPKLLDATYTDADGFVQRASYPIAYLYYTIGLDPTISSTD